MIEIPENRPAFTSHEEDEPKDRGRNVSQIGSLVAHSTSKEREKSKQAEVKEKKAAKEAAKATQEESSKDDSARSSQEVPEQVPIEDIKRAALKETLSVEIQSLKAQVEAAPEGSAEQAEAVAALQLAEGVDQKFDNPEAQFVPAVEAEYQARVAAMEEPAEPEPEIENVSNGDLLEIPEFGTEQQPAEEETSAELPPLPTWVAPPSEFVSTASAEQVVHSPAAETTEAPVTEAESDTGGILPPLPVQQSETSSRAASPASNPEATPAPAKKETVRKKSRYASGFLIDQITERRRERKRIDKRIDTKLKGVHKEITESKQRLTARESDIRGVAGRQYRQEAKIRTLSQTEQAPVPSSASNIESSPTAKQKPVKEILKQTVAVPAEVIANKPSAPEKVIKQQEKLRTPELLETAGKIYIGNTSVRRLYETNQIDRAGLVEIVQTSMRGGDVKEAFEKVELGQERQRERAREFRHDDPMFDNSTSDQPSIDDVIPVIAPVLPNTPDAGTLQPLTKNQQTEPQVNTSQSSSSPEPIQLNKSQPKTAQFTGFAILALALTALVIWLIVTL